MNMIKTKTETTVRNTYKSDLGVSVLETVVDDGKSSYVLLKEDENLTPVLLDIDPNSLFESKFTFEEMVSKSVGMQGFEDLEKYPLYYVSFRNGEVFDKDNQIVSTACTFNYIGSLSERSPNDAVYAELVAKLKEHPYVLKLEEKEIEYYNSKFHGQKGLSFAKVFLPQEKYVELYEKAKTADKDFWSVRMKEAMSLSYAFEKLRIVYGKEINELLQEYYSKGEA